MNFFQQKIEKELERILQKAERVKEEVSEEVGREADAYALESVIPFAEVEILSAYLGSSAAWYNAYSPKKYKRTYGLYDALIFGGNADVEENAIGWQFDDTNMNRPSWGGGSYNIYKLVFEGGAHGGPVHGRPPKVTTPIPELFAAELERRDVHGMIQEKINQYGQEYFASHLHQRFQERFTL